MYLEEKVEQLENLSVDQGKQIEIIAKGLATITTDMQRGFAEVNRQFTDAKQQQAKTNKELSLVKHQVEGVTTDLAEFRKEVNHKFDRIETKFDKIDERFDKMDQRFDKMDQRFDDLITLIKSK